MTRLDKRIAIRTLVSGPRRLCLNCRQQVATLHGKFVTHGSHTAAGKFTACSGSGQRPQKATDK